MTPSLSSSNIHPRIIIIISLQYSRLSYMYLTMLSLVNTFVSPIHCHTSRSLWRNGACERPCASRSQSPIGRHTPQPQIMATEPQIPPAALPEGELSGRLPFDSGLTCFLQSLPVLYCIISVLPRINFASALCRGCDLSSNGRDSSASPRDGMIITVAAIRGRAHVKLAQSNESDSLG